MDLESAKEKCCKEVLTVSRHLVNSCIKHAVWFTGGGFHIWVKLDKEYILPPNRMADLLFSGRMQINNWVKRFNLNTLDPVVSFRPDRHIRIPNTYNFKRQVWGIPITHEQLREGWDYIVSNAQEPNPYALV